MPKWTQAAKICWSKTRAERSDIMKKFAQGLATSERVAPKLVFEHAPWIG